ncbi:MAG: IS66 family transposase [Sulfurimonas sp.]
MNKEAITTETLYELMQHQMEMIEHKDKQIAALQEKVDYLLRQKFASSSEKFPANQPSLFDDAPDERIATIEDEEIEVKVIRRKRGNRTTPPASLPHIRVEHDLIDEEKVCGCGCEMRRIKELVSHQYDVIPASFQVIENVRFIYGCSCQCGEKVKTSSLRPQVLPRHQVSPSFLATIAVQKFEDALPLTRQAKIYKQRFGVNFTDTTFANWMIKCSELRLKPLVDRLHTLQLQSGYIQADETTLQVLKEPKKSAQSKSYIWLKVSQQKHPIVLMHYSHNRAAATAELLFRGFTGYVQTDGYPGYNSVADKEGVTQLGCWAHARRKFADIVKSGVSDEESKVYAKDAVAMIAKLYGIEKEIKEMPPDEKRHIRAEKSEPIVNTIRTWLDANFFAAQKLGGAIAKAFVYLNNQFEKLCVYLEDGRLAIDNNKAENHVRPIALGRKNWLFATSTKGAIALANWYSIIETAKANDLDPFAYLRYLLTELPLYQAEGRDIDPLLPWNVVLP